jgi:oxygen-dependent protoporphyrinogen oxidase
MTEPGTRCVIAGAGISGLALAHELTARGVEALVLEASDRPGGTIGSARHDGFLCERGPAGFLARKPALARLIDDLGLSGRVVEATAAARTRCVVAGGRAVPVPTGPWAFVRSPLLSARGKLRLLGDLFLPRGEAAVGVDESVAGFARRRLGAEAADRLFFPLVSGLYAGDAAALSLPASLPVLAALERDHRSLILGAARLAREGRAPLRTFQNGIVELTDALAARLGARLHCHVAVLAIEPTTAGFLLRVSDRGRSDEIATPAIVLAMPAHAARAPLASLSPRLAEVVAAIPYVPVTLVYLGYPREAWPSPPPAYGFLCPEAERFHVLGAVFSSAVFPHTTRDDAILVSVRVGGTRQADLVALPDQDLVELCHTDLATLFAIRGRPGFAHVVRHAHALPQYTLGHAARVAEIDAAEGTHPGLFVTGNAYRGLGIPDCVDGAAPLADRIARHLAHPSARPNLAAGATPAH